MSFVDTERVQGYLRETKFDVGSVTQSWEDLAKGIVFGKLSKRLITSTWLDEDSTPVLVLEIMAMLVAAMHLRKIASEEDGQTTYAEHLENRAYKLCEAIVNGDVNIAGTTEDPDTIDGGSASFFPDDTSTSLWENDHRSDGSTSVEGAAPQAARMSDQF